MNILIIGSGGREHTLAWKITQSPLVKKIYCAPGNGGIRQYAECVSISDTEIDRLVKFADEKQIDLTVVGPEAPLALGIVDAFQSQGLKIFGPSHNAAELESSKSFAKYVMEKYKIPTASFQTFDDYDRANAYLDDVEIPIVIKADGLAAGKGALVCFSREEAYEALDKIMLKRSFGDAGNKVVIEEYLRGQEASVLAFTDGVYILPLAPAQDHKAIFDGDQGPNTGGMGAYAPARLINEKMLGAIHQKILAPTIKAMAIEGRPYRGVLYAGLMLTKQGPKVVEFNCRFGDPETQVILPLVKNDIVPLMLACCDGKIDAMVIEKNDKFAVCVIMASGGYPGTYEKGKPILGLDRPFDDDVLIFHSGTIFDKGKHFTNGGRVLGVTALGSEIDDTIQRAYRAVGKITFDGAYYRKDIGYKAL